MTGISSPTEAMGGMGGGKSRRKLSRRGGGAKRSLYRSGLHGRTQKTKESNIYNPLTGSGGGNRQGRQRKAVLYTPLKRGGRKENKKKGKKEAFEAGCSPEGFWRMEWGTIHPSPPSTLNFPPEPTLEARPAPPKISSPPLPTR